MQSFRFPFPFADLLFTFQDDLILKTEWINKDKYRPAQDPLEKEIVKQCQSYLRNACFTFHLPLAKAPTEHQQRVRIALLTIPSGITKTYSEIAEDCHSHARAIGQACRHNPLPLLIPCHRVKAKQGLGGYCGDTIGQYHHYKNALLVHETSADIYK